MAGEKIERPPLQLHLEPKSPITVDELTAELGALARQYRNFSKDHGLSTRASDARLFVSSVSPGSIDIGLAPDIWEAGVVGGGLALTTIGAATERLKIVTDFAGQLKKLLNFFKSEPKDIEAVSVSDCDDAIAIAAPIANHGGSQTVNIINGDVYAPTITVTAAEAAQIMENAYRVKSQKRFPHGERIQNVSMVWYSLDSSEARTDVSRNPDKGIIQELTDRPVSVLFDEEMAHLKGEMLSGEPNPFQKVYFVDVEVSRVNEKIVSYRVTAYHGSDDLSTL